MRHGVQTDWSLAEQAPKAPLASVFAEQKASQGLGYQGCGATEVAALSHLC